MKPSSRNHQLAWSVWNARRAHTASPELRLGWMQATTFISLRRGGEEFFLTSPLIGRIEGAVSISPRNDWIHQSPATLPGTGKGELTYILRRASSLPRRSAKCR